MYYLDLVPFRQGENPAYPGEKGLQLSFGIEVALFVGGPSKNARHFQSMVLAGPAPSPYLSRIADDRQKDRLRRTKLKRSYAEFRAFNRKTLSSGH
ncbi:hypothetical protein Q3G72_030213 [Acer saccharum]|nr:hypothetical protein Q3G72_030213 [Acer saccharum]